MHDHATESDSQPAVDLVHGICAELQARQREGYRTPALVVLIDELNDLLRALQQTAEGSGPLQHLLQTGPDLGLHVVACATPTRPVQQLAACFPIHLIGSTSALQQAFLPDDGPPLPVPATNLWGSGDFVVVAGNQVARMQAAFAGEEPSSTEPASGRSADELLRCYLKGGGRRTVELPVAGEVAAFVERTWGNGRQFTHLLLTGGGCLALDGRLQKQLPHATLLDEPVMANARGLARLAQRPGVFGR